MAIHNCCNTKVASTVLLASTSQLSQDIVSHFFFNSVSKTTEKLFTEYSVLINQYALARDECATLPAEQQYSLHYPAEPVMGYLSASTVQKKRIFVSYKEISDLNYQPYYLPCQSIKDVTTAFSPYDTIRAREYLEIPNHLAIIPKFGRLIYVHSQKKILI